MKLRFIGGMIAIALIGAACSTTSEPGATGTTPVADTQAVSDTRAALDQLLGEHVFLAASAARAALAGETAEFTAAAGALQGNSEDISAALAGPLGKTTEQVFELWDSHIQMVVRYVQATAAGKAKAQQAEVDNLLAYATTFGTVIGDATGLPAATVEELVVTHITTLKTVIDDVAAGKLRKAYQGLRHAYAHMDMIAGPLAEAIAG